MEESICGGGAEIEQLGVVGDAEAGLMAATRRVDLGSAGAGKKAKRSMVRWLEWFRRDSVGAAVRLVRGWRHGTVTGTRVIYGSRQVSVHNGTGCNLKKGAARVAVRPVGRTSTLEARHVTEPEGPKSNKNQWPGDTWLT